MIFVPNKKLNSNIIDRKKLKYNFAFFYIMLLKSWILAIVFMKNSQNINDDNAERISSNYEITQLHRDIWKTLLNINGGDIIKDIEIFFSYFYPISRNGSMFKIDSFVVAMRKPFKNNNGRISLQTNIEEW